MTKLFSIAELAQGKFRSLPEVDKYLQLIIQKLSDLDGLAKQFQAQYARNAVVSAIEYVINDDDPSPVRKGTGRKVEKLDRSVTVNIPKPDLLRKNFSIVDELSEQVEGLDNLYNSVSTNFRTIRGSAETLKNIKKLKTVAEGKLAKALQFLQNVGTKHIPLPFQDFVNGVVAIVTPSLSFRDSDFFVYASESKDGDLTFTVYVELKNLATEDDSFYPKFYLVFTSILKIEAGEKERKLIPTYYVTALHEFSTPGRFNVGKVVNDPNEAARNLGLQLDLENVSTSIGVVPHNIDPKVRLSKFTVANFVRKLSVDADSLEFQLVPGLAATKVNDVAKTLYTEVKTLITSVKNAKLKVKVFKDVPPAGKSTKDVYVVKFTLTNLAREDQISVNDLDFLKEQFNLDETKLRQVVKIING